MSQTTESAPEVMHLIEWGEKRGRAATFNSVIAAALTGV